MLPKVQVNALNLLSGSSKEIERTALFVGIGTKNLNQLLTVTADTDLDKVLGKDSDIKRQINTAMLNAGQNWFGYVYLMPQDSYDFSVAVREANKSGSFEYCVNTHSLGIDKDKINALQSLHAELVAKYGRRTFFIQAIDGINNDKGSGESWAEYVNKLEELQKTIVADHVMLVPNLFGNDVGVLAGRLASRAVTIADSPARVRTGAVVNLGSDEKPKDKDDLLLDLSHLTALEKARYSTAMWYPDYEGYYWSDGRTLDVIGGDYQVIENVRVVDKVARKVRLLAIGKIADRSFNSTLASTELHKTFFAQPLREMSVSAQIGTEFFPGECFPPSEDAVEIVWKSKNQVEVYVKVRPLDCPKEITVNIFLDLKTLGGE